MKAIFSFRSKAFKESHDKRMGGFYSDHYFIISFKLALLCARQSFDRVELYTDKIGYDLLVRDNQLEFDKVHIVLDDLDDIPTDVWMAGKLYTYSLQNEPFVHLDYDLYLLEPIPKDFLEHPALVQCEELFTMGSVYEWGINWISGHNNNVPAEFFHNRHLLYAEKKAHNLGLVGGQDYEKLSDYGRKALQLIRDNLDGIQKLAPDVQSLINIVYEQYFFTQYMNYHNVPIVSYMPYAFQCLEFNNDTFVHILSTLKSNQNTCMKIEEVYISRALKSIQPSKHTIRPLSIF